MNSASKIRVGVLRGGPSSEYDISLKTGANVLQHLPEKYNGMDIFVDENGIWHLGGLPKSPARVLNQVDVIFNALHGHSPEHGQVQHILQSHHIPFTGSESFASALSTNKILSKEIFIRHGLKTPTYIVVKDTDDIEESVKDIFKTFLMPAVVKPATAGSSVGVSIVGDISGLAQALKNALAYSHAALVEELIRGREATCGVVEGFRGEPLYALIPVEVKPKSSEFLDYGSKYGGDFDHTTPGNFSPSEKKMLEDYARRAHEALGLRQYSRSDFMVTPKRGIYILETNSLPALAEQSLFPKALSSAGAPLSHFLDHVLTLAINR